MSRSYYRLSVRAATVMLAVGSARALGAQQSLEADKALLASERYVKPPAEVAKLVTAARQSNSTLSRQSPDKHHFLVLHGEGLGNEAKFAKPHYYFGGLQVDFRANRVRAFTTKGQANIEIVDAESGARTSVQAPMGASVSAPAWSPDGSKVAFFANFDDASYVYVADAKTGASRKLSDRPALAVIDTTVDWAPDGTAVYAVLVPEARMAAPKEPPMADGPLVRMTTTAKNKTPTYASLMQSPLEKAQLEYYTTGQLTRIDLKGGLHPVGAPNMIESVSLAPDARYLRVTMMTKPFSYSVPVASFGSVEQLWTGEGKVVATLTRRALREGSPGGDDNGGAGNVAADTGRRAFAWMPGGGLAYLLQDPAPRRGRGGAAAASADTSDG